VERKIAGEDQLKRVDIRAPQTGLVHQLTAHTVGGVIAPNDTIMLVVPEADALVIEAKVAPRDIDRIQVGKTAILRFTAFDQRSTPEIDGTVSRMSADIEIEQRTGTSYYVVRIAVAPQELKRLGGLQLMPGMPVEAFIKTADHKVISYLIKPLTGQVQRALRED
jgi:HlyD family secretion protein